jgi:hypothetical protein
MSRVFYINQRALRGVVLGLSFAALLSGCKLVHNEAEFYARGGPEALLDVSSEVVNLGVGSKEDLKQLSTWIAGDAPTRAELFCDAALKGCKDAQALLHTRGVETNLTSSPENMVTLVYERILARDCNPRFIDNRSRLSNEPSSAFGCSLSANIVQHVSDKRDFINPSLMDDSSSVRPVSTHRRAMAPGTAKPAAPDVRAALTRNN